MWWAGDDFTKSQALLGFSDESMAEQDRTRQKQKHVLWERKEGETEIKHFIDFMRMDI